MYNDIYNKSYIWHILLWYDAFLKRSSPIYNCLRFGITNFLLVCNDASAFREASKRGIPAFLIDRGNDGEAKQASSLVGCWMWSNSVESNVVSGQGFYNIRNLIDVIPNLLRNPIYVCNYNRPFASGSRAICRYILNYIL